MKTIVLFSTFLLFSATSSFADFSRISAFGGGEFRSVGAENSTVTDRTSRGEGGVSLEAAIAPDFGLETGFLASRDSFQIPFFFRFLGDQVFTIAFGPVAQNFKEENNTFNFGLAVAPGLNFPLKENKFNLFVETRLMRLFRDGLTDFNDNQNHLDALAGFRVSLR